MTKAILFLSVLSLFSFARAATPVHAEICALEVEEHAKAQFEEQTVFDIKKAKNISDFYLSLINKVYQEDNGETYSFAQLKALFAKDGEEQLNDLYILRYTSKVTGLAYLEVRTFPGDNPHGMVFAEKTGELLARNGDDNYEIVTNGRRFWCPSVNE